MRTRFLLDPNVNGGGGGGLGTPAIDAGSLQALIAQLSAQQGTVPVSATPPAKPVETPAETPKPSDGQVLNDVRAFLAKLQGQAVENDRRQKEEITAKERQDLLTSLNQVASKGNLHELQAELGKLDGFVVKQLSAKDEQIQRTRSLYHSAMLQSEVSRALAGKPFVSSAAARDAQDKLLSKLEVVEDEQGGISIREKKTGRPAAEVIQSSLTTEDFLHFLSPSGTGRGGIGGGSQSQPSGSAFGSKQPLTFAEQYKQTMAVQQDQYKSLGLVQTPGLLPQKRV